MGKCSVVIVTGESLISNFSYVQEPSNKALHTDKITLRSILPVSAALEFNRSKYWTLLSNGLVTITPGFSVG